jgi:copper homeostasis protein (lipoprotein)
MAHPSSSWYRELQLRVESRSSMRIALVAACLLVIAGCNRQEPAPAPPPEAKATPEVEQAPATDTAPASLESLPARYSGVLPCADCSGIRFDIDLRPANVYFLRMTYLGTSPERVYDDIGAWSLASDLHTIALRGARQSPMLFSITSSNALRKLDAEGQVIESELNYSVTRQPTYEPLVVEVPLRGMYATTNEGAVMEECTTGLKLQLQGPQSETIAQEFTKVRGGTARPALLAIEGKVQSTSSDDAASIGTLTPSGSGKFWPGESCGARGVTHELEGSRWVLVRIGEQQIMTEEGKAEPYIVLQSTTKQIVGHAGCNRFTGGYTIQSDALKLSEITTTRMACPDLETENSFLNGLEAVARWQLMDNQLVLLDKAGAQVLQFESRNL